MPHRVIITGAGGQLGWELQHTAPAPQDCLALQRSALDIADADAVEALFETERPALLINAAAYTAVDRAVSRCGKISPPPEALRALLLDEGIQVLFKP